MEKIYIQKKDKVITGPFAVEQLEHRLHSTDKIWYEGLDEWKHPRQVDFLRRYVSAPGFISRFLGVSR